LHLMQLALRDRQQPVGAERNALFELQLPLERLAPEPKRRLRARREVVFEVLEVAPDRLRRLGGGVGQVSQDVQVVERRKRARQIRFDELLHTPPGFEADLDENPGTLPDVLLGRFHEARRLPQLRHDPAGALFLGRVIEQRLPRQARPERVRIHLRVPFPAADRLELVHAGVDVGGHDQALDLFGRRKDGGGDLLEPAPEAGEGSDVRFYGRAAEVFEQVVVEVDAVRARLAREHLIEVGQVIVDKVRKWLRWVHA